MHGYSTQAVLFDLDDTLTDRVATVRAYAQQFIKDFAVQLRTTDLCAVTAEIARVDANGYNYARAADLAVHDAWLSSPGAARLAAHWDHYFVECTEGREHLGSTVKSLVQAGVRIGIVTNGRSDKQRRKVELLGLRDRVGALVISEEFGVEKPDAKIFLAAAAKLGAAPHRCMFIGDNPEKDVCGAGAVGMRAIWLRASLQWPIDCALPMQAIASLDEVLWLLDSA